MTHVTPCEFTPLLTNFTRNPLTRVPRCDDACFIRTLWGDLGKAGLN